MTAAGDEDEESDSLPLLQVAEWLPFDHADRSGCSWLTYRYGSEGRLRSKKENRDLSLAANVDFFFRQDAFSARGTQCVPAHDKLVYAIRATGKEGEINHICGRTIILEGIVARRPPETFEQVPGGAFLVMMTAQASRTWITVPI